MIIPSNHKTDNRSNSRALNALLQPEKSLYKATLARLTLKLYNLHYLLCRITVQVHPLSMLVFICSRCVHMLLFPPFLSLFLSLFLVVSPFSISFSISLPIWLYYQNPLLPADYVLCSKILRVHPSFYAARKAAKSLASDLAKIRTRIANESKDYRKTGAILNKWISLEIIKKSCIIMYNLLIIVVMFLIHCEFILAFLDTLEVVA